MRHLARLQLTESLICWRETRPLAACCGQEDAFFRYDSAVGDTRLLPQARMRLNIRARIRSCLVQTSGDWSWPVRRRPEGAFVSPGMARRRRKGHTDNSPALYAGGIFLACTSGGTCRTLPDEECGELSAATCPTVAIRDGTFTSAINQRSTSKKSRSNGETGSHDSHCD